MRQVTSGIDRHQTVLLRFRSVQGQAVGLLMELLAAVFPPTDLHVETEKKDLQFVKALFYKSICFLSKSKADSTK